MSITYPTRDDPHIDPLPAPEPPAATWSEIDEFDDEFEDSLRREMIRAGLIDDD